MPGESVRPFSSTFGLLGSSFGDVCASAAFRKTHSNVPVSTIPDNDTTTPPISRSPRHRKVCVQFGEKILLSFFFFWDSPSNPNRVNIRDFCSIRSEREHRPRTSNRWERSLPILRGSDRLVPVNSCIVSVAIVACLLRSLLSKHHRSSLLLFSCSYSLNCCGPRSISTGPFFRIFRTVSTVLSQLELAASFHCCQNLNPTIHSSYASHLQS